MERITDNRMEWAEKELKRFVPECDMRQAMNVMLYRFRGEFDFKSKITPRLIAKNWNA